MRKHDLVKYASVLVIALASAVRGEQVSDYAVQVSASVSESPAAIMLSWPSPSVTPPQYHIFRKNESDTSFGGAIATLAGNATSWTDNNVSVGSAYEYAVDTGGSYGHGFIYAGIRAPMKDLHGKITLLVDNTISGAMPTELAQFQVDLAGDGWQVIRHDVGRYDTAPNIKALIQQDYNADPSNVKAVMLFGHVPVPYSGDINPDGHPDHKGAWGADSYYGVMSGAWTDSTVNDTSSSARIDNSQANWNRPGDGKFDQSTLPADVILQVGRVDLHDLTEYAPLTETDLLKNYLVKDHNFRMGQISLQRRGIIDDNFGTFNGEAFAANGFRNFAPMFGAGNVTYINSADQTANTNNFFGTLSTQTYLWAYGCGPGYFYQCSGVGKTDNFAQQDPKAAFYMAFGSYFGDWDCEMDYLRAPLGAHTTGLACAWAGRPNWYFHHMALGENIGYSAMLTQNNGGLYPVNTAGRMVHIALMGDPTLRMYPVLPASSFNASNIGYTVNLNWSGSADSNIAGYHIYRSTNPSGPFTRVTSSMVGTTAYSDLAPSNGTYSYMVRAVKLETSSSGTFYNPSQGAITSITIGSSGNTGPSITSPASATPSPANVGQSISFSVAATDADGDTLTYSWNYGDGTTDTSGAHTYAAAGSYTATVTINDGHGNAITSSVSLTINATSGGSNPVITTPLQAWPSNPALGQKVLFTIAIADPYSYSVNYNYGDGTNGSVENHVYNSNGTYTVVITVTDSKGGSATSSTIVIAGSGSGSGGAGNPVITTPLQAWPSNPALGQKVLFTLSIKDQYIYTVKYDYGDGTTGTVENHVYNTNGAYTATITVTDTQGGTATSSTTVTAGTGSAGTGDVPIISTPLQAWPSNPAIGQKVLFTLSITDSLSYTVKYNYGDGSQVGLTEQHTYSTVGTYLATVTVTNTSGKTATTTTNVVVH